MLVPPYERWLGEETTVSAEMTADLFFTRSLLQAGWSNLANALLFAVRAVGSDSRVGQSKSLRVHKRQQGRMNPHAFQTNGRSVSPEQGCFPP